MDKIVRSGTELSARERAVWALFGDPYMRVPSPLEAVVCRIEQAIKTYCELESQRLIGKYFNKK